MVTSHLIVAGEALGGRTQACADLISQMHCSTPARVLDVGCGDGASTALLAERWPHAEIVGIDTSRDSLTRAKQSFPGAEWILGDVRNWFSVEGYDVIVASGTMQWIPEHDLLFPKLVSELHRGGVLGVQMPYIAGTPVEACLREVAGWYRWVDRFPVNRPYSNVRDPGSYYDILKPYSTNTRIWITDYIRVLSTPSDVMDMVSSSAVAPFLKLLDENERKEFTSRFQRKLAEAYPPQHDGKILFPSRRLFVVASR